MAKSGPETALIKKMREASAPIYGERLAMFKHHGSAYSEAGVHDLVGCLDSMFFSCEVKAPETYGNNVDRALREGPTLKQKAFAQRVINAGGIAWFAATVDQWLLGLEAVALHATGVKMHLPPLVSGNQPICTCPKGECEWDTEIGCYYCRYAPTSEQCPNNFDPDYQA